MGETGFITETTILARALQNQFEQYRRLREQSIEKEWIAAYRAYNGQYPPEVLALLGDRSQVYVRMTRVKVQAAAAQLHKILFPKGEKPWAVLPTPRPELRYPTGGPDDEQGILREARQRAKRMETAIWDQLVEIKWERKLRRAILEMVITGTLGMRGPLLQSQPHCCWTPSEGGWQMQQRGERYLPDVDYCSVFDLFPDPFSDVVEECEALFERHVMTRSEVRALATEPGFQAEEIRAALQQYPKGNWTPRPYELNIRQLTTLAPWHEAERFEVLSRWGILSGRDLREAGYPLPEALEEEEVQANVWCVGDHCVKLTVNPMTPAKIPYYLAPYEVVPYRIWGRGVPMMMEDSQAVLNASTRAMIDNMGISSGPQLDVNVDLLDVGEDPSQIYPWKVWRTRTPVGANPAVRVWNLDSHSQELLGVIEHARKTIDEETSLPSYVSGQQTAFLNETATGMSMLMGNVDAVTQDTVRNIDNYLLEPLIAALYHWNMQWNPDETIKGDMQVQARGAAVLMAKEIHVQKLIQFAQLTANDPSVKRPELNRQLANALSLPAEEIVRSEEELAQPTALPDAPDPEILALQKAKLQAEIERFKAEAILFLAKAESAEVGSQFEGYKTELEALRMRHQADLSEQAAASNPQALSQTEEQQAQARAEQVQEAIRLQQAGGGA